MTVVWSAPVVALQLAAEIMLQVVAGSPNAKQQAAALVQTEQSAVVPEPPAAPLVPPVAPLVPPVAPLVPPVA